MKTQKSFNNQFMKQRFMCVGKTLIAGIAASLSLAAMPLSAQNEANLNASVDGNGKGKLIVDVQGVPPKAPLFFSAAITQNIKVTSKDVAQTVLLKLKKLQGEDETMSLQLSHKVDQLTVTGANLKSWSVREIKGKFYLDIKPLDKKVTELALNIQVKQKVEGKPVRILTFAPVSETGFHETVLVDWNNDLHVKVLKAGGLTYVKKAKETQQSFISTQASDLTIGVYPEAGAFADIDLRNLSLNAKVNADGKSALVTLKGQLHVSDDEKREFSLIKGKVGLESFPTVSGYKVKVKPVGSEMEYVLECEKVGVYPVEMAFVTSVNQSNGWNVLDFTVPNGAVVPLSIDGLDENVAYNHDLNPFASQGMAVFKFDQGLWNGFLPASGECYLLWRKRKKSGDGELFFTSSAVSNNKVGTGLMTHLTQVNVKILQGKMKTLIFDLKGQGEVISVTGSQISSWQVKEQGGNKMLECVFSSERESLSAITITAQSPLGTFPAKIVPFQLTPQGSTRHSGIMRLYNHGSVRIDIDQTQGLMQLSPDQYPDRSLANHKGQLFVYRYPSAERSIQIQASQIKPEIHVSQIVRYVMGETDRLILGSVEIDIREAAVREWSFEIPDGFAVAGVTCASMADYVVSTTPENGLRSIKVLFKKATIGRQLIQLRLEKNKVAQKGAWQIQPLRFKDAQTMKGFVGVESVLGWRVDSNKIDGLKEMPLAYFPQKSTLLQQAYRVKEEKWSASMDVTEMGQNIQADVLHLYQLKEGAVEAKVLLNYFVIGAPTNQWKVEVPAFAENVSVEGENVRNWQREGNEIIVSLHQPEMGASTLLVTYEQAVTKDTEDIAIGGVKPLGVQAETGFIHVVSYNQLKHSVVNQSKELLSINPLEIPKDLRSLNSVPSVAAWQYSARPFELSLKVDWLELVDAIEQVVGAAQLNTRVTREGDVVTNARFLVKTRGNKPLRMKLPANTKLWSARADGNVIHARVDGDQFILPLPPTNDPNNYRTIEIRYGGKSENAEKVTVAPPVLSAPLTISEWKVTGENALSVLGGNVKPKQTSVIENGFSWVQKRLNLFAGVVVLLIGGILLTSKIVKNKWLNLFGNVWLLIALGCSIAFAMHASDVKVVSLHELDMVSPVVDGSSEITLELSNTAAPLGQYSAVGIILAVIGLVVLALGFVKSSFATPAFRAVGIFSLCSGALFQLGGAMYFYGIVAVLTVFLLIKTSRRWWDDHSDLFTKKEDKMKASTVTTSIIAVLVALSGFATKSDAGEMANQINETWRIKNEQASVSLQVNWEAKAGQSITLLQSPAVLTKIDGEGFRVIKVKTKSGMAWKMVSETDGAISASATYQMAMKNLATRPWNIPSGKAMAKRLSVVLDEENWQITSAQALSSAKVPSLQKGDSGASFVLMGASVCQLRLNPMPRLRKDEKLRMFVEMADIYIPSLGVIDGRHSVNIRPLSGRVEELTVTIPAGLMVGDVLSNEVDKWTFDAKQNVLNIQMKSPQVNPFQLMVVTQQGMKSFPQDVALEPLKVQGAENVVGMIGYGFGNDAQPDKVTAEGLSAVNIGDFNKALLAQAKQIQKSFVLHKAYLYGKQAGKINLKVAAVAPEVRVESKQVIRLTEEKITYQVEAFTTITRAGVFELRFNVPDGLEVESVNGNALRDWSESEENGKRSVTMYLTGKTLGKQQFFITMSGNAPKFDQSWKVPHWTFLGVARQKGSLSIIPDHGIRLNVESRKNVSQLNARATEQQHKGSVSFRLLQADWDLVMGVQKLDAWVTAQVLQEVNMKEAQTRHRMSLKYFVEHSVVKSFRVRLPGITNENASTLRASGTLVKDIVNVEGDLWEIQLRRGALGTVPFVIEYQQPSDSKTKEATIIPLELEGVKQTTHYVAVRTSKRLDMQQEVTLKGWRKYDWANIPSQLCNVADKSVPNLCYQVIDPSKHLKVIVKRHAMAGTLKLRVERGIMRTMFNADGSSISRLNMDVRVVEKSRMEATLPSGATLFNIIVNGESVPVVKENNAYLFLVTPSSRGGGVAKVQITYHLTESISGDRVKLLGPSLNVPLENLEWRVSMPDGYTLKGYAGSLEHKDTLDIGDQDYLAMYISRAKQKYLVERQRGERELQEGMNWSERGNLDLANEALSRAYKNKAVDVASNEDARVKLKRNLTSQAMMELNTRRQRLYMDNKFEGNILKNDALEEAASRNPLFNGKDGFNPKQINDYLQGNSSEEIQAMSRIAEKLISPQMTAYTVPQAIDVDVLDSSKVLVFHQDIHLAGDTPLALEVGLNESAPQGGQANYGIIIVLLLACGAGFLILRKN